MPTPAASAPLVTCTFDKPTGVMRVDIRGDDLTVILRRGPHDGILLDGKSCGATMFNTDRVRVVGNAGDQTLVLDLGGGRFGPGKTFENTRVSEVEVTFEASHGVDELAVWGTEHADEFQAFRGAVELNHDGDSGDVFGWGIDRVEVDGLGGPDYLRATGYRSDVTADGGDGNDLVVGDYYSERLRGGPGDDRIAGGHGNDRIDAGSGNDRVRAGTGNDRIRVGDSQIEQEILCGAGVDTVASWDVGDDGVATACENWAT